VRIKVDEDLPTEAAKLLLEAGHQVTTIPEQGMGGWKDLRPAEDGIRPVVELLQQVLDSVSLEDLQGAVAVATPRGVRARYPKP
jgi:hypothetical protein